MSGEVGAYDRAREIVENALKESARWAMRPQVDHIVQELVNAGFRMKTGTEQSYRYGRTMIDWRPLNESYDQTAAPWDGKPVLICTNHNWGGDDNRVHRARWTDQIHGNGIFGWAVDDCKHGPYALRGYTLATHWAPLPKPTPGGA